nr:hypothetical protein SHINE37_43172 [Rhizobiaceae bacterium]
MVPSKGTPTRLLTDPSKLFQRGRGVALLPSRNDRLAGVSDPSELGLADLENLGSDKTDVVHSALTISVRG